MASTNNMISAIARAVIDTFSPRRTSEPRRTGGTPSGQRTTQEQGGYPGDFTGPTELAYAPHPGRLADPGEVVWTWVPYEEDHSLGKDRPVLVIGRDGHWLLALPMTSQDHDRDAAQEAEEGRYWVEIGTGGWDGEGRVSEVRVDRIVRIDPERVRRVSDRVSPEVFALVAQGVRRHW